MSFEEIVAALPKLTGLELQQIAEKAQFLAGSDRLPKASSSHTKW